MGIHSDVQGKDGLYSRNIPCIVGRQSTHVVDYLGSSQFTSLILSGSFPSSTEEFELLLTNYITLCMMCQRVHT